MKNYILRKNFASRYNKAFQDYAIHVFYGDSVLLAEDLLNQGKEDEDEDKE